jgi:nicotinamide-nucleotide amidase
VTSSDVSAVKESDSETSSVWTVSNVITLARILLVPVFVVVLTCPWPEWMGLPDINLDIKRYIAAGIFILISCTDWLDGYLARSRNEVTTFGKFMDPLADKILVAAALLVLIELGSLPSWVALIILAREFIVSGVRMIAASEGVVIAASYIGKFKTVFQMIAIVMFTIKDAHMVGDAEVAFSDAFWLASWVVMIMALILTVASMLDYIVKAKDLLGFGSSKSKSGESHATCTENDDLAIQVIDKASKNGKKIATAESLTGGLISATLTAVPGSSAVVNGGIISYVNEVKHNVLGVDGEILATDGAVCDEVAKQMACNAKSSLDVDIAISVTGIAGPTGAEPGKPVGTVYMGLASGTGVVCKRFEFKGGREAVRKQTVHAALEELIANL